MNVFSEKVNKMNLQMIRECRVALNIIDDDRYSGEMNRVFEKERRENVDL